jgi:dipeptidase
MIHSEKDSIEFSNGLKIPQARETYAWMVLKIYKGYDEGDAVAINEHQVAIAGGVALKPDRSEWAIRNDPLVEHGLPGGIRYIAFERSKTARECVEMLGNFYSTYGVTYPSGVGIADPNEVWYIECGGGYTWAAVKIPNNTYMAIANGYRIGEIDTADKENVIVSPHLLELINEDENIKLKNGKFNFAETVGGGRSDYHYNTRRVWSSIKLLSPSMKLNPNLKNFPMFIVPDEKITINKLLLILRDQYEGTEFSVLSNGTYDEVERPICTERTVHTDVIQLREWLPVDIGAVLWTGLSFSKSTCYVPFYYGINKIPTEYTHAKEEYDPNSAFWIFKSLADIVLNDYDNIYPKIKNVFEEIENEEFSLQNSIEQTAEDLYVKDRRLAKEFLTIYCTGLSSKVVLIARELKYNLDKFYN